MATQLEEVSKQLSDLVKAQKSGQMDLSILENELKVKRVLRDRFDVELQELKDKLQSVTFDFKREHSALLSALDKRQSDLSEKEISVTSILEEARLKRNQADLEMGKALGQIEEARRIREESAKIVSRIKALAEEMIKTIA